MAEKIERYQFSDLDKMDKAVMKAFSSRESEAVHYEKGLIIAFEPTGYMLFDKIVRECFTAYGGKKIAALNQTPSNTSTVTAVSSR